jgi:hypothetical protein
MIRLRAGVLAFEIFVGHMFGTTPPRLLTRRQAATYCGLSAEGFDQWVRRDIVPGPIPGTQRWDRKAIDLALDRASGIGTTTETAFDDWKARRAG